MNQTIFLLFLLISIKSWADEIPLHRQDELLHLLQHDCGACHGMTLQGGLGPPLVPQALLNKSEAMLLSTILGGRPGTAMPPWRDLVTATEATWILKKLRSGINHDTP